MNAKKAKQLRKELRIVASQSASVEPDSLVHGSVHKRELELTVPEDPNSDLVEKLNRVQSPCAINHPHSMRGVYRNIKKQMIANAFSAAMATQK
jgi:hypothetical protein